MNCEQVKDHLSAYLDDALSFEERLYVGTHVESCVKCQRILADFTHFDALLAQLPRVSPGQDLRESFFASQHYLELIGTSYGRGSSATPENVEYLVPYTPRSIPLSGGRQVYGTHTSLLTKWTMYSPQLSSKKNKLLWGQRLFYGVVVGVLLVLGVGSLVSWRRWQERAPRASDTALPQREARPVHTHSLFFRQSTFWNGPENDRHGVVRLSAGNAALVSSQAAWLALHRQGASNLFPPFAAQFLQIFNGFFNKTRRNFYAYFMETRYSK